MSLGGTREHSKFVWTFVSDAKAYLRLCQIFLVKLFVKTFITARYQKLFLQIVILLMFQKVSNTNLLWYNDNLLSVHKNWRKFFEYFSCKEVIAAKGNRRKSYFNFILFLWINPFYFWRGFDWFIFVGCHEKRNHNC